MNRKVLMIISAFILGIAGIFLSFFPQELSNYLDLGKSVTIVLQLLGAIYFGFAMINWTAKANLVGGIYGRPIAIGNFTHFLIGGLALGKLALTTQLPTILVVVAIVYAIFAVLFGYVFFTHPIKKS